MNNTENTIKSISAGTFAALQFPNYKLWFFGQMVSLVGTWMQATAQQYLIYTLTGSAAYLGVIAFVNGLPSILLTLYGGVIADRIHRRTLLIITQTSMMILAFIMTVLVFLKVIQPWHVAVLAFLLGVANAFDAPARQSFVHELVDKEYMTNAIALNATMFNIGTVVGPAAAGLTYAAFGPGWCFTINGVSFIAVIIGLLLMKIPPMPVTTGQQKVLEEIKESVKYVLDSKLIRGLMINLAFMSLFGWSLIALLSAWSVTILKGDSTTYGWILSARGIGSLAAGLLLASLGNRRNRGNIWGISSLILPVLWIAFAAITSLPFSLIMIGLIGFFLIMVNNLTNAMVQTHVDDVLRGRVMGIYTLIFFGLSAIGSLIAGFVAEKTNEPWTVAICGVILMGTAIYSWFKMPYIRETE
jgi:MFS family permease